MKNQGQVEIIKFNIIRNFISSNKYPLIITLGFFLIFSYIAFFNHNYWSEDDGMYYLQLGEQILEGDGKNVKTVNTSIGGAVVYAWSIQGFGNSF